MPTISLFLVSSMDGFYLPLDLQCFYGFDVAEYENLYCDAGIILTTPGGYTELSEKVISQKKQVYKVSKDMSLIPYNKELTNVFTTIDELKKVGKKNVLVIGNDNKLNSYLFSKDWVDEIIVCTFPILLGKGQRAFPALPAKKSWSVKGHKLFDTGLTVIFYENEI